MKISPEITNRKKDILIAAATLAIGRVAYRSWKIDGELTFNVSVWGEKTKSVVAGVVDDTRGLRSHLGGLLILGNDNTIEDAIPNETQVIDSDTLDKLHAAVVEEQGWSGLKQD